MVCRLVQNQQIHLVVHHHAQPQTALLPAGEDGNRLEHVLSREIVQGQPVSRGRGGEVPVGRNAVVHQIPVRMRELHHLRQIGNPGLRGDTNPAFVRVLLSHDDFQQRGFARAVVPDQGNPFAPLNPEADAVKECLCPVGLRQLAEGQRLVPVKFGGGKAGVQLAPLYRSGRDAHPLNPLFDGKRPLVQQFRIMFVHLPGGLAQTADFRLFLLITAGLLLFLPLLFQRVKAVVSAVGTRFAVLKLNHAANRLVQKIAVMGDGQDRARKTLQIRLQPLRSAKVQMVRRLIQQQNLRILQNQPPQVDAGFFPAGEALEELPALCVRDGKAVGDLVHLYVRVIAAQTPETFRQGVVAAQQLFPALPGLHAPFQLFHLTGQFAQTRKRGAQHVFHGKFRRIDRNLGDQPDPASRRERQLPGIVIQFPGQDFEQRGLSGPVAAQKPHPFPLFNLKGQAVQQRLPHLKGFYQVFALYLNHVARTPYSVRSARTISSKRMAWDAFTSMALSGSNWCFSSSMAASFVGK